MLLTILGVVANGSVTLIALILVIILAWNYIKLLFEAAERYVLLGVLVFTAPLTAFAAPALFIRLSNNEFSLSAILKPYPFSAALSAVWKQSSRYI